MKRLRECALLFAIASSIALSSWATPAVAQDATDDPSKEFDRVAQELLSESTTTVALAKVEALSRLSNWIPRDDYAEKLTDAAASARDPLVAFVLYQKAAWAWAELKDRRWGPTGMEGPLGEQGCLVDWEIVGPFDNPSMAGFEQPLGPELGEVGPYPGKLTEVDWRPLGAKQRYCEINLNRSVQPSTAAVAYLANTVHSDRRRRGHLMVGTDGAYQVWLNGDLVARRDRDTGMWADDDAWPIELDAGANHVLVKLASTRDGGLGLTARLVDRSLKPIDAEARPERKLLPTTTSSTPTAADHGIGARVESNAKKLRGDAGVWNAWLWKSVAWQNSATPWRDVAESLLEKSDDLSPREHALLAELFDEYWQRLATVEAARDRAPDDPWIAVSYASTLEESITEPDRLRTRHIYESIAKTHPAFHVSLLQLSDWYRQHGFSERALEVLEQFQHPERMRIPAFASRYVALHRSVGDLERSARLQDEAWQVRYISSGYLWDHVRELLKEGKKDAAIAAIDEYLQFVPASHYSVLRQADIERSRGEFEAALQKVERLIAESPGDTDYYEKKAEMLLAAERDDEAVATLRQALLHRPQNQKIRDLIAFLQPQQNRLHEPWMVADVRAVARDFAPSPFNYDVVVDNAVTFVSKNGLASTVYQKVDRVLKPDGIDAAKTHRASYQTGDEQIEVLAVRVHRADGSISEDYDTWDSGGTRKGSTTYNDTGYTTMRANDVQVGDLVEFRYRISQIANENFRGDYFGDITYLEGSRPIAFQRWAVVYPEDWNLYFRAPRLEHERIDDLVPTGEGPPAGFQSTSFEMKDVAHVKTDRRQPGHTDVYDYLLVSNKKTYDEIGKWWWALVEEQLIVDEPIRKKVAELIEGLTSDDEKLRAIHNYVVKNTRYLHVGLGIHGWKPYRTSTCFRNRYGDCKDKAALLKVMLETAEIPANLVLVRTRRLGTVETTPASMHVFNHAITYVPSMDLYLDGTAEFNGTRELTSMDQGAQALVVEDGGKARMVTLPIDDSEQNLMRMVLDVDLTGEEPVTRGTMTATGANAVYFRQSLEDPERRDENLEKQLADEFPGATLTSAEYRNLDDLEKPTEVEFTMKGGQLLRDGGTREFVFPVGRQKNLLDAYAKQSKRNQDLTIRVPFANETQIRYRLAPTKKFGDVPSARELTSKFGSVKIDYQPEGEQLLVDVRYSIDVQRVAVEEYPEFRKFMADVTAELNNSIGVVEAK